MESKVEFKSYILEFNGLGNYASKCGVLIWRKHYSNVPSVVLMIELSDNKGTSVTNYSEHIASKVVQKEWLSPFSTLFFEVYEDDMTEKGRRLRKKEDAVDSVMYQGLSIDGKYSLPEFRFYGLQKFKDLLRDSFGVVFDDEFVSKIELGQPALNMN